MFLKECFENVNFENKSVSRQQKQEILPNMQRVNGCVFNSTSGFGHDIAVRLDELGFTVFAGCLHPGGHGAKKLKSSSSSNLHIVPVDVGNDDSVLKAHQYVVENLPPNGMYHFHSGFGNDLQYL